MNKNSDVLLVEDNPGDADLVRLRLMENEPSVNIFTVNRLSEALDNLSHHMPSLVLLDLNLPDSRGAETFRRVLGKAPGVPIVIISGDENPALALNAVHDGAQDFLIKGNFNSKQLACTMSYAIERQRMLTALDIHQKEQLQFKNQFLSHVSHELRTPLTSIHQFIMILLDGLAGPMSDEQRGHLETILRGTNQLRAMIADLLEATRAESGKIRLERRCLAIDEVILQVVAMLQSTAHEKQIALKVEIDSPVPLVYADSDRVIQVLINLTQNAIKFTPRGGSATVRARIVEADPDVVYISVADTGVGVSSEARLHIFERLYQEPNTIQESRKGLGLGLYITKELVRLHGGRIWLECQKEEGTVFTFTLPLFSLAKLLAPIISVHDKLRESVSLLTIEVTPLLGITDRNWRDIRDECKELLGLCILPDKDLLMPVLATTGPAESFLIVASTNLLGAHVILERMRTQLERRPELQTAASFKFYATSIPLPATQDHELKELVQQVADSIAKVATTNLRLKVIFDSLDAPDGIRDRKENGDGQIQDLDR